MRGLILAALAADLAVLVYLNALPHPFVYDDLVGVVGNPALVDGAGPLEVVRQNVFRPVVNLSFALDHALWGFRPVGYHLTSVLLHALNVALLFVLARRLAVDWRGGDAETGREPDVVAFVAASLFAVHPMMSEAVGYVSGRADVLATSFVLLALLALRAGLARPAWRAPGVGLALLGAATKEVAVVLPVLVLAWDRCLLDGDPAARRRRLLRWHLPFLGAAVALGLARATSFLLIERSTTSAAAWPYLQTQLGVVWRYVRLLLIPVGQSIVHAVPIASARVDAGAVIAALALLVATALGWRLRRHHPLLVFGGLWFLVGLAPTAAVALYDPMAERRVYLASAGFFLALAAGAGRLWSRSGAPARRVGLAAFVLVVAGLATLTVQRNRVWGDAVTLWSDAAAKSPGAFAAHYGLANALGERGRCHEALPEYEAALRLARRPEIYTNQGVCLAAEHRLSEAAAAFEEAVTLDPDNTLAHHNLGLVALRAGDFEAAHRHFLKAVTTHARHAGWRQTLIRIYELEIRDPAKTLELCRAIVRVAGRETPGAEACLERYEHRARRSP